MLPSLLNKLTLILTWSIQTLSSGLVAIAFHLQRLLAFDLQRIRVSKREEQALIARSIVHTPTQQFLAWRRSLLLFGVILTFFDALWQTHSSIALLEQMGEISSSLGLALGVVRLVSLYVLFLATLTALFLWKRPRASSRVLWFGLGAAFVIPLLLAAVPTHLSLNWKGMNQKTLEDMSEVARAFQSGGEELSAPKEPRQVLVHTLQWFVDLFGAMLNVILALPSICAIFPSVLRACLRVKTLLPESITPGWFLLSVIPLFFLLILIVFVISSMAFREPVLLMSLGMFIGAPLLHLLVIRQLMQPWTKTSLWRFTRLIAWIALTLNLIAIVLIVHYLLNLEFHFGGELLKLFGSNPDTSIMQYADLFFWLTDFLGRSVILTVAVADLLVKATQALTTHSRITENTNGFNLLVS